MEKKEELFGGLDIDNLSSGPSSEENMVDVSEFTKEPEEKKEDPKADNSDEGEDKDNKGTDDSSEDGIDTEIFENIDNSKKDNSINDGASADNSSSPLQSLADTLLAEGLIDIEEDGKVESAKDLIDGWRKKMIDSEFSDLNESQRTYLESLRNGIPEEQIKQSFNNKAALDGITKEMIEAEDNVELRSTLISQSLIQQGISPEKAAKSAKRIVEAGEDVEEALDSYNSLRKVEESRLKDENDRIKAAKAKEIESQKKSLSELKDSILKKDEFIPGFKANSSTKEKVFKNMTDIASYDAQGNPINAIMEARLKDPQRFAEIESYLFTITNGYKDFSKFKNTVKSNAIEDLDKKLKSNNTGGGTPKGIMSTTQTDLLKALDFNTK